jgi:protein-S-isoprenylcysteine O-methyltransferase Ste14
MARKHLRYFDAMFRILRALAGLVLFAELPVPLYWLILHPSAGFWRRHLRAAFWIAGLGSWTVGGVLLFLYREELLASTPPRAWQIAVGFSLIAVEFFTFLLVERQLGTRRLVGHAELTRGGELETSGLYSRIRHPRYAAMFCAMLGACLIGGTPRLWLVAAVWWLVQLGVIALEEREMMCRFGPAYAEYRRRVPAFLPFRLRPR